MCNNSIKLPNNRFKYITFKQKRQTIKEEMIEKLKTHYYVSETGNDEDVLL